MKHILRLLPIGAMSPQYKVPAGYELCCVEDAYVLLSGELAVPEDAMYESYFVGKLLDSVVIPDLQAKAELIRNIESGYAIVWTRQSVIPLRSWDQLSSGERKLVMQQAKWLTSDELNMIWKNWVSAGKPIPVKEN